MQEDFDTARRFMEESLSIKIEIGWTRGYFVSLANLVLVAIKEGNYETAWANFKKGMTENKESIVWQGMATGCAAIALLASYLGSKAGVTPVGVQKDYLIRAARLSGIASTILSETKSVIGRPERQYNEQAQEIARQGLGETAFATAFAEGQAIPREQIIEYVMSMEIITNPPAETVETASATMTTPLSATSDKLTNRELEVLKLVAAGLTDPQIAEKLGLSPRTVNAHLRTIFSKLDVTTRTSATRYAIEHKLV
jgi:DNA-binding CsgD family transcriptional regulator